MALSISYDENLIADLAAAFDLRQPNIEGLSVIVRRLESNDFDPHEPLVLDLATGAGKTYIMASLIEYLRRQGHKNVMVVTPNKVVQDKTVNDLRAGSHRYIGGFDVAPSLVTPDDVQKLRIGGETASLFAGEGASTVYVFNVQQLFPPKEVGKNKATGVEAQRRKTWRFQEEFGVLGEKLIAMDDLVIIADESHLFGPSAKVFRESLTSLDPAATVGLTASSSKEDNVIFRYPLWRVIKDGFVKQPVLVYRRSGYDSEERQLQDAVSLLRIKEQEYAAFREAHPTAKKTKPVLFVVCSDVNHATETADYLRTAHFTSPGSGWEVLQVDNQHDDSGTQSQLRYLDAENSPVRVIVSVNKLREGWDTKRIAVMCTLRAMGSEVLTQQVMGRGLRLPFGTITGIDAIDELYILSHKSFVNLLESENVIREFGIEEDVPDDRVPAIGDDGADLDITGFDPDPSVTATGTDTRAKTGDAHLGGDASATDSRDETGAVAGTGRTTVAGTRQLGDEEDLSDWTASKPVEVKINEGFAGTTFLFPSSSMSTKKSPFSLLDVPDDAVIEAAKKVQDTSEYLDKTKIIVADDGTEIAAHQQDREAVPSFTQSEQQVRRELTERVVRSQFIHPDRENSAQLTKRIVPLFMERSGVKQWTEKAKASAVNQLLAGLKEQADNAIAKNTSLQVKIKPIVVPVEQSFTLPAKAEIVARLETTSTSTKASTGFSTAAYYGPWTKGLFEAARFDSFSAEYQLAELLNFDKNVQWWTRIYSKDNAVVAYSTEHDYVPDFVVYDTEGTHWIVEGKADNKRDDDVVLAKRQATERLLRQLISHPDYEEQSWGYLMVFEDDIRHSESLEDLIQRGNVERMPKL
ncbi:DEAD/DEAH box helicase [Corynebacterium flavescens]|uniref:DEAD/DEAH box helicase n=1 Tax=Corynebacterium flavescens TaxID=28028 RepID=UPI003FCF1953